MVENNFHSLSQILSVAKRALTREENTTLYNYGNGPLVQEYETGGYLLYHFDHIGSTSAVTDMDGTIVHAYAYGTYGEQLSGSREGIRFLYNGRYGVVTDENGLWYLAEGDHFSALASFVSAIPGWGDVAGAVGKTAKGCSRVSRMVRYGSKIVGRIGNIALGSYQTGSIAVSLYDKHIVQGESWDWDSTVQLFSAGLFATTTALSVKGLKGGCWRL